MSESADKPADLTISVWPHELKLLRPIAFGSETIASLTFRRGTFGDLKGLKIDGVPPIDDLIKIASRLCGQPSKVIESLCDEDVPEVMRIAMGFFSRCLGVGSEP